MRREWAKTIRFCEGTCNDRQGEQLFTAEWLRRINLSHGGVAGDMALGAERLSLDVRRVVLIRFLETPEPRVRP